MLRENFLNNPKSLKDLKNKNKALEIRCLYTGIHKNFAKKVRLWFYFSFKFCIKIYVIKQNKIAKGILKWKKELKEYVPKVSAPVVLPLLRCRHFLSVKQTPCGIYNILMVEFQETAFYEGKKFEVFID